MIIRLWLLRWSLNGLFSLKKPKEVNLLHSAYAILWQEMENVREERKKYWGTWNGTRLNSSEQKIMSLSNLNIKETPRNLRLDTNKSRLVFKTTVK